jgi:hypothetical protein
MTPGRRSTAASAAGVRDEEKASDTSWRSARKNVASIMKCIESMVPRPMASRPTEKPMPRAASSERTGWRNDVAEGHHGQRREYPDPLESAAEELAIDRRRRRLHGDGGGQRERGADRLNGARQRRGNAGAGGDQVGARICPEEEKREGVELGIQHGHLATEPCAERPRQWRCRPRQ